MSLHFYRQFTNSLILVLAAAASAARWPNGAAAAAPRAAAARRRRCPIGTSPPLQTSSEMSVLPWVGGLDTMEHCVHSAFTSFGLPPMCKPSFNVLLCNGRALSRACSVLMGIGLCLIVLL